MKIQYQSKEVTVFESVLFRTTCTVILTDDLLLLVDPNWLPNEIDDLREYVKVALGERPLYLLFTHSDYDHIIGYKAFPTAKVIASAALANKLNPEVILAQIQEFDDQYYIKRDYPIEYPEVDIVIEEGMNSLMIGKTELVFYLAKGHNDDGIFTIVKPLGVWLAGDYLSNVEFPYVYYRFSAYLKTLDQVSTILAQHNISLLVPGHGDITESPKEILWREKVARKYIHDVSTAIKSNSSFDFEQLMENYDFPIGMRKFHEANMALAKQEFRILV